MDCFHPRLAVCVFASLVAQGCIVANDELDTYEADTREYAGVFCDALLDCCDAAGFTAGGRGACIERVVAGEEPIVNARSLLREGEVRYDSARARSCLQERYEVLDRCESGWAVGCLDSLTPLRRRGERCLSAQSCIPSNGISACAYRSIAGPGVCVPARFVGLGEPCDVTCDVEPCSLVTIDATASPARVCRASEGLHCGTDDVCEPIGVAGSACATTRDCAFGFRCRGGVCEHIEPGRDCMFGAECVWFEWCDDGTCVPYSLHSETRCE